ncbi:bifunctional demethylmenaquinone methyltransferase/2-methoxy-6-polyprenyl-1,4-benzoquinol methylase UbiE [Romeria aff. gracilis LEGE 07310]|uniref:2-phytyl-1,4-naphtoquinone methyltransferase n=1 Tax=Vasconcelosia minhoensis LEGE 07310 TaxID=915328 RepID=A0A8J7DE56_9CYAN|nr:bifunctional demethylmenaquinone methyltransferase/2-methoxy-6-polyprenyl-1,4-benzoquinol methylase UbiE [Romeria gracilis]MBE9079508.1 bifunctional demethylmenaquinone methyltransferase/2-methoxy-6-polyprenyl-1,4-benzoquinol methylase UbiE [Romeria aff. gracilis LEGE 07310]
MSSTNLSTVSQPDAEAIRALFNRIAPVYDTLNQSLSLGLHRVWKQMAQRWSNAQPGMTCLDLCCGSGDLALLLARQVGETGHVVGVDFAAAQLAIAAQRAAERGWQARFDWVEADAQALPFVDASFDAATMAYGLRNLTDIPQGLAQLRRVLKPGATAAVLDFHWPSQPVMQQLQQWYLGRIVVPTAERYGLTAEYAYIGPSVERFPLGPEQVCLAQQAGFSQAVHYPIAGGIMGILVATR